jgi:hypothetical protein
LPASRETDSHKNDERSGKKHSFVALLLLLANLGFGSKGI